MMRELHFLKRVKSHFHLAKGKILFTLPATSKKEQTMIQLNSNKVIKRELKSHASHKIRSF